MMSSSPEHRLQPSSEAHEQGFTLIEMLTYLGLMTLMMGTLLMTEQFAQMQSVFEAAQTRSIFELQRLDRSLKQDVERASRLQVTEDGKQLVITRQAPDGKGSFEVRYGYFEEEGFDAPVFARRVDPLVGGDPGNRFLTAHLEDVEFERDGRQITIRGRLLYRRTPVEEVLSKSFEQVYRSRIGEVP